MAADQKMARINVDDETWTRLQMHALRANRSVADYLGELIRRDIDHHAPDIDAPHPEPSERTSATADPAPRTGAPRTMPLDLPADTPQDWSAYRAPNPSGWIPPWEE